MDLKLTKTGYKTGKKNRNKMLHSPARKYHGLVNQGATCYLNSVLQVLFMTEDFREAVKRHTNENPGTECIDHHLTSLFDELKVRTAYTFKITNKLGIDKVYEQRDAAEYIEKILGLITSPQASQIFHGLLTHKTICYGCHTETGSDGAFWYLPLALVDSCSKDYDENYSVVDGLNHHFRASDFSGENQMYCEKCDMKCDATIECEIKHHPKVLMLLLKRFEFDYRYMTYIKKNCTVGIPCTLQIYKKHTYELYAVVEHFGDLRGGHYIAKIKPQNDERWFEFNDTRVTLLDYQPFQTDGFERSSSAYLLFYRKKTVPAAETCTQDIGEVSTPGGFQPPATSDIDEQCPDTVKSREREEGEGAAEVCNATAEIIPINRNEETVGVESRGLGLSSDLYNGENQDSGVYARQSRPYSHQEWKEERQDLRYLQDVHAEKQRDEGKTVMDDEVDIRGDAQAAEKREILFRETQLEESVDEWGNDVRQRRPQQGLVGEDIHDMSYNKEYEQEDSDKHVRCHHPHLVCVDMPRDGERMGGETEGGDAEQQDGEGLGDVRQIKEDSDLKPANVDEQGDGERMEVDKVGKEERQTGADERGVASGKEKLLKKYDLCYDIPGNGRVGDSKQNMPKDVGKRQISSRFDEQPREEKRDVQVDKGDDKHAQRRGASAYQQDENRRLDDVRSRATHKDVGAAKQAKEQEKKGDNEHIQRRAGSAGSSRVTENRGGGSVEKSQPKARTQPDEDAIEGRHASKLPKTYHGKIIEVEIHDGVQTSCETENIKIRRDSTKSWVEYDEGNVKSKSDPDAKVSLSEGVCNLKLNDSPKPQKRRNKEMIGAEVQAGKKHTMKNREKKKRNLGQSLSPLKRNKKEEKKPNKTSCFCFPLKRRKNADQTSESD